MGHSVPMKGCPGPSGCRVMGRGASWGGAAPWNGVDGGSRASGWWGDSRKDGKRDDMERGDRCRWWWRGER